MTQRHCGVIRPSVFAVDTAASKTLHTRMRAIPLLEWGDVARRAENRRQKYHVQYLAMYSSVLDGIVSVASAPEVMGRNPLR